MMGKKILIQCPACGGLLDPSTPSTNEDGVLMLDVCHGCKHNFGYGGVDLVFCEDDLEILVEKTSKCLVYKF